MAATACTWTRADHGSPRRLGTQATDSADWAVGADGGVLSTPDGSVAVNVPKGAAERGTQVRIKRDQTPRAAGLAGFVPLSSFDITAQTGRLRTGEVSVRYDNQRLNSLHSNPDLLVMLIADARHGWLVLPTTADRTTSRATARWPHFSSGILGSLRTPAKWLIDHVVTYPLGPKKPAKCTKKDDGWKADPAWKFTTTNWNGGR